jgi:hypothetical protein
MAGNLSDNVYQLTGQQFDGTVTKIDFTATAADNTGGSALKVGVHRIVATEDCHIVQGGSSLSDATTSSSFLPARAVDFLTVTAAADAYVSAIRNSADGSLYITHLG